MKLRLQLNGSEQQRRRNNKQLQKPQAKPFSPMTEPKHAKKAITHEDQVD